MVRYITSKKQTVHVCEIMDKVNDHIQYGKKAETDMEEQYQKCMQELKTAASFRRIGVKKTYVSNGFIAKCKNLIKRIIAKVLTWYLNDFMIQQTQFNEKVIDTLAEQQKMLSLMIRSDRKADTMPAVKEKKC